jgi:hypothetical protein
VTKDLEIRTVAEAKTASRRPKTVIVKTRSAESGGTTKVLALDGNSASFSDDFLYVFKANVKAARKKTRERRAAAGAAKPVG